MKTFIKTAMLLVGLATSAVAEAQIPLLNKIVIYNGTEIKVCKDTYRNNEYLSIMYDLRLRIAVGGELDGVFKDAILFDNLTAMLRPIGGGNTIPLTIIKKNKTGYQFYPEKICSGFLKKPHEILRQDTRFTYSLKPADIPTGKYQMIITIGYYDWNKCGSVARYAASQNGLQPTDVQYRTVTDVFSYENRINSWDELPDGCFVHVNKTISIDVEFTENEVNSLGTLSLDPAMKTINNPEIVVGTSPASVSAITAKDQLKFAFTPKKRFIGLFYKTILSDLISSEISRSIDGVNIYEKDLNKSYDFNAGVIQFTDKTLFGTYEYRQERSLSSGSKLGYCEEAQTNYSKFIDILPTSYYDRNKTRQEMVEVSAFNSSEMIDVPYDPIGEQYIIPEDCDRWLVTTKDLNNTNGTDKKSITNYTWNDRNIINGRGPTGQGVILGDLYYGMSPNMPGPYILYLNPEIPTVLSGGTEYITGPKADQCKIPISFAGKNEVVVANCLVHFPADIGDFIDVKTDEDKNVIIKYFRWKVKSEEGVIIDGDFVLGDGAMLESVQPDIFNYDEKDMASNWVHTESFDEEQHTLGETRAYFDNFGNPTQTQVKNLTSRYVLASEILYDAGNRAVIQTLPAPLNYRYIKEPRKGCGDKINYGTDIQFQKASNFTNNNGNAYQYTDFDIANGFGKDNGTQKIPAPLTSSIKGTLGYYYSSNNKVSNNYDLSLDNTIDATMDGQTVIVACNSVTMGPGTELRPGSSAGRALAIDPTICERIYENEGPGKVDNNIPESVYPFSQQVYSTDGTNQLQYTTLPGDKHYAGSGHYVQYNPVQSKTDALNDIRYGSLIRAEMDRYLDLRKTLYADEQFDLEHFGFFVSSSEEQAKAGSKTMSISVADEEGNPLIAISNFTDATHAYDADISYSIYNKQGKLAYAVSPNGTAALRDGSDTRNISNPDGWDGKPSDWDAIDKTSYKYDYQGRLTETTSADKGTTRYRYARDGRLLYSQNAAQAAVAGKTVLSYTLYDQIGRVTETGEFTCFTPGIFGTFDGTMNYSTGYKTDVKEYGYDSPVPSSWGKLPQTFTKGRLSYIKGASMYLYSYDAQGRIIRMDGTIQDHPGYTVEYSYNAQGNVEKVAFYTPIAGEEMYHYYRYDKDGKLKAAYISRDKEYRMDEIDTGPGITKVAEYFYYPHGPLKRTVLGDGLQNVDYVYTIQGWLKSINDPQTLADASAGAADLFGMTLHYFAGDYTSSSATSTAPAPQTTDWYNGTIKGQTWATRARDLSFTADNRFIYEYNYDTRGQLMYGQFSAYGGSFHSGIEWMTYDRNGNIKRKTRSYAMSTLTNDQYSYPSNSNRLAATINGSKRTSYTYNAMGQMTAMDRIGYAASTNALLDHQEVTYNSDGLVKEIRNGDNVVYFKYDPSGMLIEKLSIIAGTMATTRYARDASGNVLAVLNGSWGCGQGVCGKGPIDFPVYGSSRIGVMHYRPATATAPAVNELEYELTDHLGNVRATFTRDALTKITLASSADYYPYGTKIPGSWTRAGGAYRYGYQGQYAEDNTDETGYTSFEARMLDNERARWFVPDPSNQYWSGYVAMGNNPVSFVDPDGRKDNDYSNGKDYVQRDATNVKTNQPYERVAEPANPGPSVFDGRMSEYRQQPRYGSWEWCARYSGRADISNIQPQEILLDAAIIAASLTTSAAKLAAGWQGKGAYTGVDKWRNIILADGKYIVGGLPGQSNYYTTISGLNRSGLNKSALFEGLQVAKHPQFGYRGQVGIYKVTGNTPAAFGTTYANPQFGAGGLPQLFIPDYSGLQLIKTIPLK